MGAHQRVAEAKRAAELDGEDESSASEDDEVIVRFSFTAVLDIRLG
jgi:hypothetical protein